MTNTFEPGDRVTFDGRFGTIDDVGGSDEFPCVYVRWDDNGAVSYMVSELVHFASFEVAS